MQIYKYETSMGKIDFSISTCFLAGPSVRKDQPHLKSWRPDAVNIFRKYGFDGNIIIPEFSGPIESATHNFGLPLWEFEGLKRSDVILFWIPRTEEMIGLTTNYELGYWTAMDRNKVVYGRPDSAYRMSYCDTMWVEDSKSRGQNDIECPIYNVLEQAVIASIEKMNKGNT